MTVDAAAETRPTGAKRWVHRIAKVLVGVVSLAPSAGVAASPDVPAQAAQRSAERGALRLACLVAGVSIAVLAGNAAAHQFLCDDAYISFRYAEHLLAGHGLVFNVGERVEGYTNFLWVLELAGLGWLGIGTVAGSLVLSSLCTVGALVVTVRLALRRARLRIDAYWAVALALLFLCTNRNFAIWATSGLETRQFTFWACAGVLLLAGARGWRRAAMASAALAGAALTRPEGMLLFACCGIGLLWMLADRRLALGRKVPMLGAYVAAFALIVGLHLAFRVSYYGEWLPNTYYAKHVRPWPEAGLPYVGTAFLEGGLYLVLPLALWGAWRRFRSMADFSHVLSFLCIAPHAAYLVRIGGDHFEFRPMDFYWPLLSVAAAHGTVEVGHALARRARRERLAGRFVAAIAAVVLVYSTVLQVGHDWLSRNLKSRMQTFELNVDITPDNYTPAAVLPLMGTLTSWYNELRHTGIGHGVGARWKEHAVFRRQREAQYMPYRPYADALFTPNHIMALPWIGVAPFALRDLTVIDTHGLTDATIARTPVTSPNEKRKLAHDREPPPGYLERRGVNIDVKAASPRFAALAGRTAYALQLEPGLWMPLESKRKGFLEQEFASKGLWALRLSPRLADNYLMMSGQRMRVKRSLGRFDSGSTDGWHVVRGELSIKKLPRIRKVREAVGSGLIDTYNHPERDRAVMEVKSPRFTPRQDEVLFFLLGGSKHPKVAVELWAEDQRVASWRGRNWQGLELIAHDLSKLVGKACQLRVVDDATDGSWAHIVADHFLLAAPAD